MAKNVLSVGVTVHVELTFLATGTMLLPSISRVLFKPIKSATLYPQNIQNVTLLNLY